MMLACLLALYREFGIRPFPHCGMFLSLVSIFYFILKYVSMEQNMFS